MIAQSIESMLAARERKELVRLVVIGSVDDGKSTLIGRLLWETGALYDDQIEQVRRATRNGDAIDFSLFTDGLRAEREQGITIDVAHRYFETRRRKFILADTPGHAQYTRNMATGASTAHAGIVLVDARLGVLPQTRRHAAIASLLGIPRLLVAVNKMDLVGFEESVFRRIVSELREFAAPLGFAQLSFVPVSARLGDNVALPSARMPWHREGTVLDFFETVEVPRAQGPFRFPVQTVLRHGHRLLAGQIASGSIAVGDEVVVLPSGARTRVSAIETWDGALARAEAPMSISLRLADEVDAGRGDLLAPPDAAPKPRQLLQATVVWLTERPLDPARAYLLKHTTRTVPARIEQVRSLLDPETLEERPAASLRLNDVGRVAVRCARQVVCDPYRHNRSTGAFILIDALSNETAAAGTISEGGEAGARRVEMVAAGSIALAHEVEELLAHAGHVAAVVQRPEAALACAAAGIIAIYAGDGPLPDALDLRHAADWRQALRELL